MWAIKKHVTQQYIRVRLRYQTSAALCCWLWAWWETLLHDYQSHHHYMCVCLWVKLCVCFLLWQGGAGWTNMSFWVSGCRANIDQSALRHVAGQIKHSSGTKSQWHALSPGWISLRLSDWPATHHTHQERHRLLQMVLYFKRYSLPFVDVYFSFFSSSC